MIRATLKKEWILHHGNNDGGTRTLVPGTYELDRIPNPRGHPGNWLVLKGTTTGMAEGAWTQWINGVIARAPGHPNEGQPVVWGDYEIILEEDGVLVPPPRE